MAHRNSKNIFDTKSSRRNALEDYLLRLWSEILHIEDIKVDGDFFQLGGDYGKCSALVDRLQSELGAYIYTVALYDAPTVNKLSEYLEHHYEEEVKKFIHQSRKLEGPHKPLRSGTISLYEIEQLQRWITPFPQESKGQVSAYPKNPPAIFILAAPRSGSTLLRVMLAGHPRLFAPPELNLLSFNTLGELKTACSGRYSFMKEGIIQALMELNHCDSGTARGILEGFELQNSSTQDLYRRLQEWMGGQILVDKTTAYALDIGTLRRGERYFDEARFIHLTRHPQASALSFEEVRFDRLFFRGEYPYHPRQLGELIWYICNNNILEFLQGIPDERKTCVAFEELVREPESITRDLCKFLEIDFHPAMLHPYQSGKDKMTHGVYAAVRMQGDPKFHQHQAIDPSAADRYMGHQQPVSLGVVTWQLAQKLGYQRVPEVEFSVADRSLENGQLLHRGFENQVNQRPDATALIINDNTLTYKQLSQHANRIAYHLINLGVRPEALIGLCMERSLEMVIGMLAILKAGGIYVPMDPVYPPERLAFMIADAGPKLVLSQEKLNIDFPQAMEIVYLDINKEITLPNQDKSPSTSIDPDNGAYVLYTSGSTGEPKGVLITHRGAYNVVQAEIEKFEVAPESRVLQYASLNFDTSVVQIFMALGSGATLILVPKELLIDQSGLTHLLRSQKLTHIDIPPSVLRQLPSDSLPDVKVVSTGGERCTEEIVSRWSKSRRFFNCYGTTETAICSTIMECDQKGDNHPPVGLPIKNTHVYLLDEYLKPVPLGAEGSIYIGGYGIARGYLNHPGLTADKFVPDPFSHKPGARLYTSGDVGYYDTDGNIMFVGRSDDQIKIRGNRVEPGEIETTLREHPGVQEAVILPQVDENGNKFLIAYIVPEIGEEGKIELSVGTLREFIRAKLPDYMIPEVFISLEKLPRTPTNKVDRKKLTAIEWQDHIKPTPIQEPKTPIEQTIAAVWQSVLRIKDIGLDENFFDLGGHSLRLMQVHGKLKEMLDQEVRITDLFRYPTIQALATFLSRDKAEVTDFKAARDRAEKKKAHIAHRRRTRKKD
jgi:amino acid adenylation domain-containing protein